MLQVRAVFGAPRQAEPHELSIPSPEGVACRDHAGQWVRVIDFGDRLRGRMLA